jgi:hypothetical protein
MVLRCLLREAVGAGCAPTGVVRGGGGAMGALSWAANPSRVLAACNAWDGGTLLGRVPFPSAASV